MNTFSDVVEYIKEHGLMKDGVLTQWEVESIPLPNPSKAALVEKVKQ